MTALTSAAGWPTNHGDNQRSGNAPTAAHYAKLKTSFTAKLDGAVYGSPIVVGRTVVAATENNSVYALNADTGRLVWYRHLHEPIRDTSVLACAGNIKPTGITGSPAYDPATGRIFVMTISNDAKLGVHHEIFGLRATDGATVMNRRIDVPGTDPRANQQRAALAVDRGNVYVAFGGLAGDCGDYKGAVISLRTNGGLGATAYIVPTGREAGIWAPGGPVVDKAGNVYVAIGNGESTSGEYDYSDSVTKLSPRMQRLDFFAPTTWAPDNAADLDLGSMSPAMLPNGLILQAGKSGKGYTMRADHLGGIGGQLKQGDLCRAFGVSAVNLSSVYMPCTDGVTRVDVAADGTFTKKWTANGIPGSPVIGPGALYSVAGGKLYALSSVDGRQLGSIAVGAASRFATPALFGGKAYVPTLAGLVGIDVR